MVLRRPFWYHDYMPSVYENKSESNGTERYNEQNKACLEYKLREIIRAFHDRPKVLERVIEMQKELKKIRSEQVAADSHFAHILGQLNTKLGFVPRYEKQKERGEWEKAINCEKIVKQTEESIITYMNLCLRKEKDYFYGEISSRDGYWDEKTINKQGKKIQELNADEFVQISAELLEEKERQRSLR